MTRPLLALALLFAVVTGACSAAESDSDAIDESALYASQVTVSGVMPADGSKVRGSFTAQGTRYLAWSLDVPAGTRVVVHARSVTGSGEPLLSLADEHFGNLARSKTSHQSTAVLDCTAAAGGPLFVALRNSSGGVGSFDVWIDPLVDENVPPGGCVGSCGACPSGRTQCGGGSTCVDLQSAKANCGQCGVACTGSAKCVAGQCQASGPSTVALAGKCRYEEVYRSLSCPTGMACTCYDRPIVYFNAAASQLQVSLDRGTSPSLEILGGAIPPNKLGVVVSPMKIPLTAQSDGSLSGGANFFSAAVTGSQIRVVVNDQTGYRSESYLKYSSDDCGFGGNRLYCTFQSP